jgi:cytochrome bd-type quinol oxidase subunit 1
MTHHITDVHFDCSFTIKLNFQQHIFSKINVSSSVLFHTLLEVISTSLALFISILALVRYSSKKNDVILFIGVGFLGTALL